MSLLGWGKKTRNRRQERGFQLDVRLRTEVSSRTRRREWLRVLGGLTLFVGIVAGAITGGVLLRDRWLYRVEALALRQIPVSTDGVLPVAELMAQAGLRAGMNTFAVDLPAVRGRLLRHPRVATAEVQRELPGTIRIRVRERFPVARIKVMDQPHLSFSYLLDETGHVLLPLERGRAPQEQVDAEAMLPVVVGVAHVPFVVGTAVTDAQVLGALRLLAAYESSTMAALADVVSVDVGRPGELELLTVLGSRVNFALRESDPVFGHALVCWHAVHMDAASRGRLIGSLDLSVTNHAPLRWMDGASAPVEPVQPIRPKRKPIRRHV